MMLHGHAAAVVALELLLQLDSVGGEVARGDAAAAAPDIESVAAVESVGPGGEVAEAGDDGAAIHHGGGGFSVARFGDGELRACSVDLVDEVVAHHAAGVGELRV